MYEERLQRIEASLKSVIARLDRRDQQQLVDPIDPVSQILISQFAGLSSSGLGSAGLTQNIGIASTPATIQVPAAYEGTIFIESNGQVYEVPYINTP